MEWGVLIKRGQDPHRVRRSSGAVVLGGHCVSILQLSRCPTLQSLEPPCTLAPHAWACPSLGSLFILPALLQPKPSSSTGSSQTSTFSKKSCPVTLGQASHLGLTRPSPRPHATMPLCYHDPMPPCRQAATSRVLLLAVCLFISSVPLGYGRCCCCCCCCCCCFSRVRLYGTPWMAAHQAPPPLGFSRQEHWSGLPFLSPMHESEKWKWSRSVVSDPQWPHGLQPTRLLRPWDFPGKSTGVGCHCLLQLWAL